MADKPAANRFGHIGAQQPSWDNWKKRERFCPPIWQREMAMKQSGFGLRALRSSTAKLGDGLAKMEYKPRKKFVKLDRSTTVESSNMWGRAHDSVQDSSSTKCKMVEWRDDQTDQPRTPPHEKKYRPWWQFGFSSDRLHFKVCFKATGP